MMLTQSDIKNDWRGDPLDYGSLYMLVDHATVIRFDDNDVEEMAAFLDTEYPAAVDEYQPTTTSDWLECLSDCTTSPEYHIANIDGVINCDTEVGKPKEATHERISQSVQHHAA